MTAKNANGERLFSSSEFLTNQQIAGFFSRLTFKKKLAGQDHDDHDLDDEKSQENEAAFAGFKDKVMDEVMIRHPIYYDNHNICKLAAIDKLSKLSVGLLNDICEYFGITTQDFDRGRKAPYITKLVDFVKESCSCKCKVVLLQPFFIINHYKS